METHQLFTAWSGIYLLDLLRYLIPAGLAYLIFWVWIKKRLSHLFIQTVFPKNKQLWMEFKYSMSTVVIFSLVGLGIYTSATHGYTFIYGAIEEYGWGYLILSFLIMILFHDFYFYITHRLMHHPRIYKYVHRVHHQSTNPSPWAAYSFHPLEAVIQAMVLPILVFTMPVHSIVIFAFTLYMILRNVLGHLGYEIFPKGFTQSRWCNWHTTSTHHNMHHKYFDCNYGLYFSWWDNIFKTTHNKYDEVFIEIKTRKKSGTSSKSTAIAAGLILTCSSLLAQSISGEWISYHDETGLPLSSIAVQETHGKLVGKVSRVYLQPDQGENPLCVKCEGENKNKPVLELEFLWGFKKIRDAWTWGKILDPSNGVSYTCKMWIEHDSVLWVRGYADPFNLFYRTEKWIRASEHKNSESPEGIWNVMDENSKRVKSIVSISLINNEYKGKIVKIIPGPYEGSSPLCYACKGTLHDKEIVGMTILYDFKNVNNKWVNGKVLDPANGKTYSAELWLEDDNTLLLRGYWGPFFRSQRWRRSNIQTSQYLNSKK